MSKVIRVLNSKKSIDVENRVITFIHRTRKLRLNVCMIQNQIKRAIAEIDVDSR